MRHPAFHSARMRLFVSVIAAVSGAFPLSAQISVSDTVRLQLRSARFVLVMAAPPDGRGILIRHDSVVLVLQRLDGGGNVEVPLSDIANAEVLRGTRRIGWPAVALGLLAGAGTGAMVGAAAGGTRTEDGTLSAGGLAALGGLLGSVAGLTVGGIVAITSAENWVPIDATRLFARVELAPRRDGFALGLRWVR
jgi:hypothetical protein